jgi:2-methylcitrate dehydratase
LDRTTKMISSYATTLQYSDLTPETLHSLKRSFIDTLACAVGGSREPTSMLVKKVITSMSAGRDSPSRILGTSDYVSPDMAAFANTVLVHNLNWDPMWRDLKFSGGFPGRTIPAILAVAGPMGASGRDVMTATAVAYDVCYRLAAKVNLHALHWNQSFYTGPSSCAGLANLMGLTQEQTGHALSMTALNLLRLRQTRAGRIPMWKSADCADVNRDVVLYMFLAREGMTGPDEPFDGKWGLWHQSGAAATDAVVPDPQGGVAALPDTGVTLEAFGKDDDSFKVNRMSHKFYPTHGPGVSPISMALELRDKVQIDDIEAINIQAYNRALYNVGGGPDKSQRFDPQTREDADHSIPWLVAVALRDGTFGPASYRPESLTDPNLRPLMSKVTLIENPDFSDQFPAVQNMRMEIVTRSGQRHTAAIQWPKGYFAKNPLSDAELEAKFSSVAEEILGQSESRKALDVLWHLDELDTMEPVFDALMPLSSRISVS